MVCDALFVECGDVLVERYFNGSTHIVGDRARLILAAGSDTGAVFIPPAKAVEAARAVATNAASTLRDVLDGSFQRSQVPPGLPALAGRACPAATRHWRGH